MIDTIVLTIPNADMIVWEKDNFTPSLKGITDNAANFGAKLFHKYTYNIPQKNGYFPRLTVTPRWDNGLQIPLRIEFSVPKLIYGNNVDELEEADFDNVVYVLRNRLKEMGVVIFSAQLENATVSAIHFSKNIPLSDHYTASFAIQKLGKLDVNQKLDINHRHFQNDGHALYFDCGSYQIVLYDKMRDIVKSSRHSVDKDKTTQQLALFNDLKANNLLPELLRIEIRIVKKVKLNSLLKSLGFEPNPNFKQIFNKNLIQAVLLHYWNFIKRDKNLFLLRFNEQDILKQVIDYQKSNKIKLTSIETLGIAQIIAHSKSYGLRNLKTTLLSLYSPRTWFRMSKYFDQIDKITASNNDFGFIEDIEQSLLNLQPYKTPSEGEQLR